MTLEALNSSSTPSEQDGYNIFPDIKLKDKIIYYSNHRLNDVPQLADLDPLLVQGIKLASLVFPFKVNSYVLDNLIDWRAGPDDPIFRLVFPHPDMLLPDDRDRLKYLIEAENDVGLAIEIERIRASMNPNGSDQLANVPLFEGIPLKGVQHKYDETALFFAKQAQTCHSYCTFCFRWPQFVQSSASRFEADDAHNLLEYLKYNRNVSDILLTGGDPMVMSARRLTAYLAPLLSPEFAHIRNVRIGTKSISYWPHRFLTEKDSGELLELIARLSDGGKHVAIMAHVNHWRELAPEPVHRAVAALRGAGAILRTQSPVLRHINDSAGIWHRMWTDQVQMGMIPYYMFMERDTGASHYFGTGIARALEIYQSAAAAVSGICRTARGPVMSAGPGKIHVLGTLEIKEEKYFLLSFLQARRREWLHRPFIAKYSDEATWMDDLSPPDSDGKFFFDSDYGRFLVQNSGGADSTIKDVLDKR